MIYSKPISVYSPSLFDTIKLHNIFSSSTLKNIKFFGTSLSSSCASSASLNFIGKSINSLQGREFTPKFSSHLCTTYCYEKCSQEKSFISSYSWLFQIVQKYFIQLSTDSTLHTLNNVSLQGDDAVTPSLLSNLGQRLSSFCTNIIDEFFPALMSAGKAYLLFYTNLTTMLRCIIFGMLGCFMATYLQDNKPLLALLLGIIASQLFPELTNKFLQFGSYFIGTILDFMNGRTTNVTLQGPDYQNLFTFETLKEFLPILTPILFIATIFGSSLLPEEQEKLINDFINKKVSFMQRTYNSAEFTINKIQSSYEDAAEFVHKKLGIPYVRKTKYPEFVNYFEKVNTFKNDVLFSKRVGEPDYNKKVRELVKEGDQLMIKLTQMKKEDSQCITPMFNQILKEVTKMNDTAKRMVGASATLRPEPHAYHFYSQPGMGKSNLISMLSGIVCSKFPGNQNPESDFYCASKDSEYFDGYTNQRFWVVDDAYQVRTEKNQGGRDEFNEFIRVMNTFPFRLNKATLEDKDATYCRAEVVVTTSNVQNPGLHATTINSVDAFLRRYTKFFEVCVDDEYLTTVNGIKVIDTEKTLRKFNSFSEKIYKFKTYTCSANGQVTYGETINFDELVNIIIDNISLSHTQFQLKMNKINGYYNKGLTSTELEAVMHSKIQGDKDDIVRVTENSFVLTAQTEAIDMINRLIDNTTELAIYPFLPSLQLLLKPRYKDQMNLTFHETCISVGSYTIDIGQEFCFPDGSYIAFQKDYVQIGTFAIQKNGKYCKMIKCYSVNHNMGLYTDNVIESPHWNYSRPTFKQVAVEHPPVGTVNFDALQASNITLEGVDVRIFQAIDSFSYLKDSFDNDRDPILGMPEWMKPIKYKYWKVFERYELPEDWMKRVIQIMRNDGMDIHSWKFTYMMRTLFGRYYGHCSFYQSVDVFDNLFFKLTGRFDTNNDETINNRVSFIEVSQGFGNTQHKVLKRVIYFLTSLVFINILLVLIYTICEYVPRMFNTAYNFVANLFTKDTSDEIIPPKQIDNQVSLQNDDDTAGYYLYMKYNNQRMARPEEYEKFGTLRQARLEGTDGSVKTVFISEEEPGCAPITTNERITENHVLVNTPTLKRSEKAIEKKNANCSKFKSIPPPSVSLQGFDRNACALADTLVDNTYFVCYSDKPAFKNGELTGSKVSVLGHLVFIQGRVCMMNYHLIKIMQKNCRIKYNISINDAYIHLYSTHMSTPYICQFKQFTKKSEYISTFPGKDRLTEKHDLFFMVAPKDVRDHKTISHLFIERKNVKFLPNAGSISYYIKRTDKGTFAPMTAVSSKVSLNSEPLPAWDPNGLPMSITLTAVVDYPSSSGYCGALAISTNTQIQKKIYGMHAAKYNDRLDESIMAIITQEDVSAILHTLNEKASLDELVKHNDINNVTLDGASPTPPGSFLPVGYAKYQVYHGDESKIQKSVLYEKLGPSFKDPAIIAPIWEYVDGEEMLIDPYALAVVKTGITPIIIDKDPVNLVKNYMTSLWLKNHVKYSNEKRVLSFEECWTGVEGDPFISSLNMSSSVGYPYRFIKNGYTSKAHWFGTLDQPKGWDHEDVQLLKKDFEDQLSNLRRGIRNNPIVIDELKMETRPKDKIKKIKTRVFSISDVTSICLGKALFGDFVAFLFANRIHNGSSIGINTYTEFQLLRDHLRSKGDNIIAGDYSNYDGTLPPVLMKVFAEVANDYYQDSHENKLARVTFLHDLIYSYHVRENVVFGVLTGQPSGNYLTSILNTFVNIASTCYCFLQLAKIHSPNDYNIKSFQENVSMNAFGDDNLISVHHKVKSWFNMSNLTVAFKEYLGMTYTDEEKTGNIVDFKSLRDVQYLQCKFRYNERDNLVCGVRDKQRIIETLYWLKSRTLTADEQLACNVEAVCYDFIRYPFEEYQQFTEELKKALIEVNKSDLIVNILDYENGVTGDKNLIRHGEAVEEKRLF